MKMFSARSASPRVPGWGAALVVCLALLSGGCERGPTNGGGGNEPPTRLASITLDRSEITLDDAGTATIVATGRDSEQRALAAQPAFTWRTADPAVAAVSGGTLTGTRPGQTTVVAEAGGLRAEARVVVNPVPTTLAVVSGEGQTGPVGAPLAAPLVVRVADRHAAPVAGVPVRFALAPDAGRVAPADAITDAAGEARTVWTLPERAGASRLEVTAARVAASARFGATAVAGPVAVVQAIAGDAQTGAAGATLGSVLTVRATDASGNPVPGAGVAWAIRTSGGSLVPLTASTDADGRAHARWTLGAAAGAHSAEVTVGGRTLVFSASAFAAPVVVTGAVQQVTATRAAFSGTIRPNAAASTVWFEWAPDTAGTPTRSTPSEVAASAEAATAAAAPEQLTPATRYFVRAAGANAAGTRRGTWVAFTTLAVPPDAPTGLAATPRGQVSVGLAWRAVADEAATFRIERNQGSGWAQIGTSAAGTTQYTDNGLAPATSYVYRLRACNTAGCSGYSAEVSATTEAPPPPPPAAPGAITGGASAVTATTATLAGTVSANGSPTQVHFEYSTSATLAGAMSTPPQAVGADAASTTVSAPIGGLTPATTYSFRIVATSAAGTERGDVRSFSTGSPPVQLPDLAAAAVVGSTYTAGQGGVQIRVTLSRSGGPLVGSNHARANLYWSADARWDASDTQLWVSNNGPTPDFPVDVLNASGIRAVTATIAIPSGAPGGYHVIVVADPERFFDEISESNNAVSYPVTLTAPVPAISSVSPNPVQGSDDNQPVTLTGTNFVAGATARVRYPGGPADGVLLSGTQVTVLGPTSIRLLIRTGTTAGSWSAQVINPGGAASNQAGFTVTAPPPPPLPPASFTWPTDPNTASNGSYATCGDWPGVAGACFWLSTGGWRDAQPFQKHLFTGYGYHLGADWNLGSGSNDQNLPVHAVAAGVVSRVLTSYSSAWGNIVFLRHTTPAGTFTSMYAHVNWNTSGPPVVGASVSKGQQIARIGNANGYYGTAYHLHFELRRGDNTTPGSGYTTTRVSEGPQAQIDPNSFIATHR